MKISLNSKIEYLRKRAYLSVFYTLLALVVMILLPTTSYAEPLPGIDLRVNPTNNPTEVVSTVKLLVLLSVLSLAPAFIMMVTSFTRIVVVLSLLRGAIGLPMTPPNQVLIGLSLLLTIFIMAPVYNQINENAIKPYMENRRMRPWNRPTNL